MTTANHSTYHTAELTVCTATGEVRGPNNQSIRLSPVNLRVLLVLLNNGNRVSSRQQLFDVVWPNQVVSEDALTKCISDLRNQLKDLTPINPLINTIPKKGYRWLPEVNDADQHQMIQMAPTRNQAWTAKLKRLILAVLTLMLLMWILLASIKWYTQPNTTPLVILPTQVINQAPSSSQHPHMDVAAILKQAALRHENLNFLSQYAIESHQGNPFPHFSHEFGVQWFIESEVYLVGTRLQVTLNLVDARTALVIHSVQYAGPNQNHIEKVCEDFMGFVADL